MATPRKLTPAEQRLEDIRRAEREAEAKAVRAVGVAQAAIDREKQRHAKKLAELEEEFRESQVIAVTVLGAKLVAEVLNMRIPTAVRKEAKARIDAAKEAKRERARPAPKTGPELEGQSGPDNAASPEEVPVAPGESSLAEH